MVGPGLDETSPIQQLRRDNLMRYGDGTILESSQVQAIQSYYERGMLNGNLENAAINYTEKGHFKSWELFTAPPPEKQ